MPSPRTVRYGVPGAYTMKAVSASIKCDDASFGVTQATPYQNFCDYVATDVAVAPTPAPAPAPSPAPAPAATPAPAPSASPAPTAAAACYPRTETPEPAGTVVYNGPGVIVPADYGCWHNTNYIVNNSGLGYGPDPNYNVFGNTVRIYGMNGLDWSMTETSPGTYNWSNWDTALRRMKSNGVKRIVYNPFNVPNRLNRMGTGGGDWKMQWVPEAEIKQWLSAVRTKVQSFGLALTVEVANEVFAGSGGGSWVGTNAELSQFSDYILNWRNASAPDVQIWSPSIPGFGNGTSPTQDNVYAFFAWLKTYPRRNEFDAFSMHLYGLTADHMGEAFGANTDYTGYLEYRALLRGMGITKPVVDGEKGFWGGTVSPGSAYNYAVKSLTQGVAQTCFFQLSQRDGSTDSNVGEPWANAWAKADIEDAARLAGRKITKVVKPNSASNGRFWVQTDGQCYGG